MRSPKGPSLCPVGNAFVAAGRCVLPPLHASSAVSGLDPDPVALAARPHERLAASRCLLDRQDAAVALASPDPVALDAGGRHPRRGRVASAPADPEHALRRAAPLAAPP